MTRLSVNINKFATIRNARGGNNPDLINIAKDCESFGAQGITVHPRPDERHIRYNDVFELKEVVNTEFNIEGFPDQRYLDIIAKVKPTQATIVPDKPDALTSNAGWDIKSNYSMLSEVIMEMNKHVQRVSIFVDPDVTQVEAAAKVGASRIELYTEPFASNFNDNKFEAINPYIRASEVAKTIGLAVNAGHDLNLENLHFLHNHIVDLAEVSIGHALVCDALYYGLENTIQLYLRELSR